MFPCRTNAQWARVCRLFWCALPPWFAIEKIKTFWVPIYRCDLKIPTLVARLREWFPPGCDALTYGFWCRAWPICLASPVPFWGRPRDLFREP